MLGTLQTRPAFPRLSTIVLISLGFGGLSFLYSFFDFLGTSSNNAGSYYVFNSLTLQEIGGHFLFGYVVALPTRNLKLGILAGLMALALDTDHILAAVGGQLEGRIAHSISFAFLASVLIGMMASQMNRRAQLGGGMRIPAVCTLSGKIEKKVLENPQDLLLSAGRKKIFSQFLCITLAAFMSHIAYDVFVDTQAAFPLLVPFSFNVVLVPQIYALAIEGAAILLVYFYFRYNKRIYSNHLS
jgi:hypothetical protein